MFNRKKPPLKRVWNISLCIKRFFAPKASSLSFTVGVVDTHGTTRLSCFFLSELKPKQTNVVCVRFFFLAFFPGDVTAPLL